MRTHTLLHWFRERKFIRYLLQIRSKIIDLPFFRGSDASYKAKKEQQLINAIKEITTPNEYLTDPSILCFIDLVNREYKGRFNMADVVLSQSPELFKEYSTTDKDDVQILYGGVIGNADAIGHYIAVFYKHSEKRVYVFDSLFNKKLSDVQQKILKVLYPNARAIRHIKPKTLQPDGTSCGVFAIASVTTAILGEDPKKRSFKLDGPRAVDQTMGMRNHLKQILLSGKLSLFPA